MGELWIAVPHNNKVIGIQKCVPSVLLCIRLAGDTDDCLLVVNLTKCQAEDSNPLLLNRAFKLLSSRLQQSNLS